MRVEVCCNSLESALNAQKAGADRIELCSELGVGGITPSYGLLKAVSERISIPVRVLIRPRGGDFTYSDEEFEVMKIDVAICNDMGFEGIVSGVLKKDFTLDVERTKQLMEIGKERSFTFHRAFDWVKDPYETLGQLDGLGVDYILTSGQRKSAVEGIHLLNELRQKARHSVIMPGGGIRIENTDLFKNEGFEIIHLTGTKFHRTMDQVPEVPMNSDAYLKEDQVAISDQEMIRAVMNRVK